MNEAQVRRAYIALNREATYVYRIVHSDTLVDVNRLLYSIVMSIYYTVIVYL